MDDLKLSQTEIEDTVRRYANVLLTRWAHSLKDFVTDGRRSLVQVRRFQFVVVFKLLRERRLQLVQSTINIGYLGKSCDSLSVF